MFFSTDVFLPPSHQIWMSSTISATKKPKLSYKYYITNLVLYVFGAFFLFFEKAVANKLLKL